MVIVVNGNPTDHVIVRKSFGFTRVLRQAMYVWIFDNFSHTSAASKWSPQINLLVVSSKSSVLNSGSWVLEVLALAWTVKPVMK